VATAGIALPDALSAPAREFISRSHGLLIGSDCPEVPDRRTVATLNPATGREIAPLSHAGKGDQDRLDGVVRSAAL
jgi:hypothetical protein